MNKHDIYHILDTPYSYAKNLNTLSVILQVSYYKKTKKRLFKMSPIHHHFELSGWNENKIVSVFSLITLVASIIGILAL